MYGIDFNEAWNIKRQFILSDFFNLYSICTLHCEFLYVGMICILAGMISIPVAKGFIYMQVQCVYLQAWSVYTHGRCLSVIFFTHRSEFLNYKNKFFPTTRIFTCGANFYTVIDVWPWCLNPISEGRWNCLSLWVA